MGFQAGLSGLNASSKGLDVIGNNIANANTYGMKASRAEFSELVSSAIGVAGGDNSGIGVTVGAVSQQFSQGTLNITGNNLDAAINGNGFFQLQEADGSAAYTRAGNFKLDKNGFIVTNSGAKVLGYQTNPTTGKPLSTSPTPLTLPTSGSIAAKATADDLSTSPTTYGATAKFNLPANATAGATLTAADPLLGQYSTTFNAYDSLGNTVPVSVYFQKTATAGTWNVYTKTDTGAITAATPPTLKFTSSGALDTTVSGNGQIAISGPATPTDGANQVQFTLDLTGTTQFASAFATNNVAQTGYADGKLTGVKIGADGTLTASYSNGTTQSAGQLALASFRNNQGLMQINGGDWKETFASGPPTQGTPGSGNFGALQAGALEESNVDLTQELVNMMTAQRSYQANAQTIKTEDQIMNTLVNLR